MLGKLKAGGKKGNRMSSLDGITDAMDTIWQTPGDDEGQGCLACYSQCGCKELDTNW